MTDNSVCNSTTTCPCDSDGVCTCAVEYQGDKCDDCAFGYTGSISDDGTVTCEQGCDPGLYPFPTCTIRKKVEYFFQYIHIFLIIEYFLACNCNTDGTVQGTISCSNAGVCPCNDGYYGNTCQGII